MPHLDALVRAAHADLRPGAAFGIKRDFLRSTPISPPHGDTSRWALKAQSGIPTEGSAFEFLSTAEQQREAPLGKMRAKVANQGPVPGFQPNYSVMSGFIKFRAVAHNTEGQIGALTFDVKYADDLRDAGARAGWLSCWFLPWKSGHLLKMRIPGHNVALPAPSPGILPPDNADIFFTAAINGCSVFVYGAEDSPMVVHAGIGADFDQVVSRPVMDALGGEGASIWRNLLNGANVAADGTVTPNPVKVRQNFAEVNRFDYVSQQQGNRIVRSTADSEAIEAYFARHRRDTLQASRVLPWGCVCGVRAPGGEWTFILQRNLSVTYQRVTKTKGSLFSKSKIALGPTTQTSINIGSKIFFPQPGQVHMRDVASLTVV